MATLEKPVVIVEGGPGKVSRESFRDLWAFREVLWAFLVRQVKVRYSQAAVGVGWALLQPLISAVLIAFFIGRIAQIPSEGQPFLLFALAGVAPWTSFSSTLTRATETLVSEGALLRKVYFPREVLPLSGVGAGLTDLAPSYAVLIVTALLYGALPGLSWLALVLPLIVLLVLLSGLSLVLSALNLYYRDVRLALPFLVQLGLYASPVLYPVSLVPERWRSVYLVVNPVATSIDGTRRIILHNQFPQVGLTAAALAWSIVLLVISYTIFKRLERNFADRL